YSGFKNGEVLGTSGVTGSPSLTTTATPTSPVSGSPYTITAALGTLASGNYGFSFVAGALPITKATLTVPADDTSRPDEPPNGTPNPAFTYTITGFKNGETASVVSGTASCSTTATATSSVTGSPYLITCTLGSLSAANYGFSFVDGDLTITKATLTVTADDTS